MLGILGGGTLREGFPEEGAFQPRGPHSPANYWLISPASDLFLERESYQNRTHRTQDPASCPRLESFTPSLSDVGPSSSRSKTTRDSRPSNVSHILERQVAAHVPTVPHRCVREARKVFSLY